MFCNILPDHQGILRWLRWTPHQIDRGTGTWGSKCDVTQAINHRGQVQTRAFSPLDVLILVGKKGKVPSVHKGQ